MRHKGGQAKRQYRVVDFNRTAKLDIEGRVKHIEYDPNRSARVALVVYTDGEKCYILAPHNLSVGDTVMASRKKLPFRPANRMPLEFIPSGTRVYNVEFQPEKGGQLVRTAGSSAQVMGKEGKYVGVKLPSKEVRLFPAKALATIGQLSNIEHSARELDKAGRSRHKGRRPTVRGTAMSAGDHPHGGGEGRGYIGGSPQTPWGKHAYGKKGRRKKKKSNKFIVKRRK